MGVRGMSPIGKVTWIKVKEAEAVQSGMGRGEG